MRTIKEILHTADGIGDKPMRTGSPEDFDELVDAARHVIATAFGNTYGMTAELQLEALRSSVVGLQESLDELGIEI